MASISERTTFLAYSNYVNPVFRKIATETCTNEFSLAFLAATYALRKQYEDGEISNFGTDPTIDEVAETIIKLSIGE